jgi:phospholipid/cholesterol/gamma-HCH transport system substrate-binding protein
MSRNAVETVMGAVVLVVAALFLFFAYSTTKVTASSGNTYTAEFSRVDGVRGGTDVRINGIKVGQVVSQTLDPKDFSAVLRLTVDSDIKLSTDSVASIRMSGLLGDKYVDIEPGNEDATIPPGGRIEHTQAPFDIEQALGQMIFGQTKKDTGSKDTDSGAPAPAPGSQGETAPQGGNAPASQGGNAPAPQ